MLEKLLNYLENKKIMILGFGMEGKATYNFLRKNFPEKMIYISDKNKNLLKDNLYLFEDINVEVTLGELYLNGIEEFDLIIKAPGISLKDEDISKYESKITSELELFLQFVNVYTIGITGTKGKSTTSTLMYKILKDQGKDAYLLGNIGEPIFNEIDCFTKNSIAVIELSSHALEFVKHSPKISILLNIYEEHLDHYKSLEKYIEAKYNIAKYQKEEDYFIYNADNKFMREFKFKEKEHDYAISLEKNPNKENKVFLKENSIYCNNKFITTTNIKMKLKGIHIINNIMFIFAVCNILNLNFEKALNTIESFKPLEHRMEYVGKYGNIEFYNDSIATIPESTINSIKAIPNVNTIIIGGKDRGVNLDSVINFLKSSNVENIICLPKTGEFIYEKLNGTNKNCYLVSNMSDAVKIAKEVTKKDMVCLLSPAASSYGYFKNFEERGKIFKDCIKNN